MLAELDLIYTACPDCGGSIITLAVDNTDLDAEAGRIAWSIFNNVDFPGDIIPEVAGRVAMLLRKALIEGYGSDFPDIDFKSPDFEMLRQLEQNVYSFSAAKNYQELKQATVLLKDGDRVRTYNEFKTEMLKLHNTFNKANLQTEYGTAVNGSELAARWTQFQGNKEAMPFLIYQTVGDSRVRASHKALDGVKRPIDDDFWKTYYPPNDWNCRCTVNQTGSGSATPDKKVPGIDIPKIFRTNLANQGLIYPAGHPYFVDIPPAALRNALAWLPEKAAYIKHDIGSGPIDVHILHAGTNTSGILELQNHLEITDDLYKLGFKNAKLLPNIQEGDIEIKPKFYPKNYTPVDKRKNPDTWIKSAEGTDMVCDYKYMTNKGRTLGEHISNGASQAEYVVIKLSNKNHTVSVKSASKLIDDKLTGYPKLKGVIILNHDGTLLLKRYR